MQLHTAGLVLRDFVPADAARVFAWQSTPAWLALHRGPPPTRADVDALVGRFVTWAREAPRTRYQLAITVDDRVVGTCGVRADAIGAPSAEFGCELDPACWGRGYAREAARVLLAFGFATLRVGSIVAITTPGNHAAIHLATSLGFRHEGGGHLTLLRPA